MNRLEREKRTFSFHLISWIVSATVGFILTVILLYSYCRIIYG